MSYHGQYQYNNKGRRGMRYGAQGDERSATETQPKTKIIPSSQRGARLREELLSKILTWQKITASFDNFPYYIEEHTKSVLMECVASNLKDNKLRKYSAPFNSSSGKILLQSIPGTELYREKLVSALARELQVPLLRLDDDHGCDEQKDRRDGVGFVHPIYLPQSYEEDDNKLPKFKKGDRVLYVGRNISLKEANNRTLLYGQRGEVYEVSDKKVAVVFNISGLQSTEAEKDEKNTDILRQAIVVWLHVEDVVQDLEVRMHDFCIAMEKLFEVLESQQPLIVYFADSFLWPPLSDHRNAPLDLRNVPSLGMMKNIFSQLPEGVVIICPENNWEAGLELPEEVTFGVIEAYPKPLKKFIERSPRSRYPKSEMHKLFDNVVCIKPPMDEDLVNTFIKQIEQDRLTETPERNLETMQKVLKANDLSCTNLEHLNVGDMIFTRKQVEKIVGWAINHYSLSCPDPCVNEEKLHIPHDSIKIAISRFTEEEKHTSKSKKKPNIIQDLAMGGNEKRLVSAVVRPEDIDVKFDDVGVVENVKKVLNETVVLPLKRPELFSDGNTLRPCKGILLFGPPGTGKTVIAKALAKESGANFIHITSATFTSMCFGALSSFASKLAPVIIYLDEVDTFLGAHGRDTNGTSKLSEFVEAWDGWKSKGSLRILLIGATNRPFDLDEAVIRHMPRRIYVGLPDLENRSKILKLILNKENLESGFSFEQLAESTDGYSGSDLKNLCAAAKYGPIEEFLEQESKGETCDGVPAPRPLNLNDFIHSKSKVRSSVTHNARTTIRMREWNEQYGEGEI